MLTAMSAIGTREGRSVRAWCAAVALCLVIGAAGCGSQAQASGSPAAQGSAPAAEQVEPDGARIHVAPATLPDGMRFLDELPRTIGEQETLVARYALDAGLWDGDGPYLRVVTHRDPGIARRLADGHAPDAQPVDVDGAPGVYDIDESTDPQNLDLPDKLADLQNPWTTLTWPVDDDLVLAVQAKGLTQEQLTEIAEGVTFDA